MLMCWVDVDALSVDLFMKVHAILNAWCKGLAPATLSRPLLRHTAPSLKSTVALQDNPLS